MADRERESSTVHLTRIYTKTGDDGTTALGDMSRRPKTDSRVAAYGDVDETNSTIGVALALGDLEPEIAALLRRVQNDLFDVGADLSTPMVANPKWAPLRVDASYVDRLEQACDTYNERLTTLDSFVLPGGSAGSALLHVARTAARRAERSAWDLIHAEPDATSTIPALYLNRLSDLLFILSRVANDNGRSDVKWRPRGSAEEPPAEH